MRSFNKGKLLLAAAALLPLTVLEANPGFSRQMDMSCMACHNQTMSQLNSFGRKFAASGFTMTSGSQSMIDGNTIKLGLPSALNAGVLLKARYVKTDAEENYRDQQDVGFERGNLEIFKVSKVFFGGKIADNVGGFMNYMDGSVGGKVAFSSELGSGYAGISTFMQDDFGPFSGMEYYNTGLYAPLKLFENRKGTNAAQATEVGHGPATGMQAYYAGDMFYAMGGAYVPATSKHEGLDVGSDVIGIARIAIAPTFGDWMVMVGAYGISGTSSLTNSSLDNTKPKPESAKLLDITREAFGLDAQVEGQIGGMSTVLTLNAVLHNKTDLYNHDTGLRVDDFGPDDTLFTDGDHYKAGENSAFSAELQVNPWDVLGFKVAYLHYDDEYDYRYTTNSAEAAKHVDKMDRDEYSLGVDYSFRQNVRFAFEYTYSDYRVDENIVSGQNHAQSDSNMYILYAMIGF